MTESLKQMIDEAAAVLLEQITIKPKVGIILGTGLGDLARKIEDAVEIPYSEIPHFPHSTVESHAGQIVAGRLSGVEVLVMEGRFHYYEGYSLAQVTFPVRVMRAVGAKVLIATNACGGMNPLHEKGDLVIMEDHINLLGGNPLIGLNDEALGARFPDMIEPYDRSFQALAADIALRNKIRAHRGVFVAVAGPCLETRAEYRFLRGIGADTVGMSTVPEVIVAIHGGMRVLGISVVTDICLPDALEPVNIDEIIAIANDTGPRLETLITSFLAEVEL